MANFGSSCIYRGYRFGKVDMKNLDTFEKSQMVEFKGHESICYAFEFVRGAGDLMLTSSFYDKELKLVKIDAI